MRPIFALEILTPKLFALQAWPVRVQWIITLCGSRWTTRFEGASCPFVRVREAFPHVDY
jgi:hypothetical protein